LIGHAPDRNHWTPYPSLCFNPGMTMTAPNPSRFDPKSILEQAFEMGEEFPGPAEDLLLSWLLSLASDQEPMAAAAALLPVYAARMAGKDAAAPIARLHKLLEQVALSPPAVPRRGRLSGRTRRS
jgi:hypothetical protein